MVMLFLEKSLSLVIEIDLPSVPGVALAYLLIFIIETHLVKQFVSLLARDVSDV